MGTKCVPECGGCACGKCAIGSLNCTIKEEKELQLIEENMEFVGDRFEVVYPWIKDPNMLLDNRSAEDTMLRSTERRLEKTPKLAQAYSNQIKDLVDRGVATKLSNKEMLEYSGPIHFLTHHEVINEENQSTPLGNSFQCLCELQGSSTQKCLGKGTRSAKLPLRNRDEVPRRTLCEGRRHQEDVPFGQIRLSYINKMARTKQTARKSNGGKAAV